MANPEPAVSLWLDGRQSFQLGRKGSSGTAPVFKVHMHDTSNPLTLVIPSYNSRTRSVDLRQALQAGAFELFDAESHTKIPIPQENIASGELFVKAGAPTRLFDLKLDAQDEFWTQLLTSGREYEVSWAQDGNGPWAYRGEPGQSSPERMYVRLGKEPVTYAALDETMTPLSFTLSIKSTDKICNMSGEPQFGFNLKVTSYSDDVITVCLDKTPLKEMHGLEEIVKVEDENGHEVEWDWGIGCWDGPEPFPSDDMFEEFKPGVPYEKTFWLAAEEKNNNEGELRDLEAGMKYTVGVSRSLLRSFANNQRGNKADLLSGSEEDKKERWAGRSELVLLEVSEPFTFDTV